MNTPKQYGIWNLLFWILIFHIPLIFHVTGDFFGNLLSEPKYENQAIVGITAIGFGLLGLTVWLYIPAIGLCIGIMGERPPQIAMVAFCSCQAFITALSLWLFKRAKARDLMKLQANITRCSEPGDGALVDIRGSVAPGR
jgi:hypothetical protein